MCAAKLGKGPSEGSIAHLEILHTKLHPPEIPGDLVSRLPLLSYLSKNSNKPLSLVSAPAGYGKSTLVSHWLKSCNLRCSWVSLDEFDNDLRQFLGYLLAGIRTTFPDSCRESESLLKFAHLPSPQQFARKLLSDLSHLENRLYVVLDDFQFIHDSEIMTFILELLRHPSPSMQLVIVSRRDPPIPLTTFRSKNQLTEVRAHDLRFTAEESRLLVERIIDTPLQEKELKALVSRTEGWAAGLRLTGLSLRNQPDRLLSLEKLPQDNRYVIEYIVAEVISQQLEEIQKYLLAISILNRFCRPLCNALFDDDHAFGGNSEEQDFFDWLTRSGLFLIPLDTNQTWFRFHHLIKTLLQHELQKRFAPHEIALLHVNAGTWFAKQDQLEEALHFLLLGNDVDAAISLISSKRHELMNLEQWHVLDRCLDMLPNGAIDDNPGLLITKAWSLDRAVQLTEIGAYTERAETVIASMITRGDSISKSLIAEVKALKSFIFYLAGEGYESVSHAEESLRDLDQSALSVRGFATILLAGAYQMTGQLSKSHDLIYNALKQDFPHGSTYHSRLFTALCFINWIAADMDQLRQSARELLKIGVESNLNESISLGHYFLGNALYCVNDLAGAAEHFKQVFISEAFSNTWDYVLSGLGLAWIHVADGNMEQADKVIDEIAEYGYMKNNTDLIQMSRSFKAEIALRQGNVAQAAHWVMTFKPRPFIPGYRSYIPQFTLAKTLLAQSNRTSLAEATSLLSELYDYYRDIHNTKYLADVCLLQGLQLNQAGDTENAFAKLGEAIEHTEPSRLIRPFTDLGKPMFRLLSTYIVTHGSTNYLNELLISLNDKIEEHPVENGTRPENTPSSDLHDLDTEALTFREIELLQLLSKGMSNIEIADSLFISPETVKSHLSNIYRKLEVKNRRLAVLKASSYGLV